LIHVVSSAPIVTIGDGLTVTTKKSVAVQPLSSAVAVYVVVEVALNGTPLVTLLSQEIVPFEVVAVKVTSSPSQTS
jgi:hypothetical protein